MDELGQGKESGSVPPAWWGKGGGFSRHALIGREAQLARLQTAFQQAVTMGEMRVVTLTGEPGIGKTSLAAAFLDQLTRQKQPYLLLTAQGSPRPEGMPFSLLHDLLAFRFDIRESDSSMQAREKLLRGVAAMLGPESIEAAHWIGHLAGCDFEHSPYLGGRLDDPRRARQASFQSLNRFFSAAAQHAPLVIVADDLQWADEASLEWLDLLACAGLTGPVLLINVARSEILSRYPEWGERWPGHFHLPLNPLPDEEAAWLTRDLLLDVLSHTVPLVLVHRIASRAGGNPMMIEELVRLVAEMHLLAEKQINLAELPALVDRLPGGVNNLLEMRLKQLPAADQEILRRAAVIGPVFWQEALYRLDGTRTFDTGCTPKAGEQAAASAIGDALTRLEHGGWIERRGCSAFPATAEYAFRTALLFETVSSSLETDARRTQHAAAAAWLAAHSGARAELFTSAIAGHYELAGEFPLAAEWYGLAALHARRSSAPESAVDFFRRALSLLPDEPGFFQQRAQLYKGLWDVQWWQAHYDAALRTSEALRAAAERQGDLPVAAAAWNRIAAVQNRQNDYTAALRSVQRAERLARTGGAAREVVLALFNRGVTLYRLGDAAAALEAGEQALAFNKTITVQSGGGGADPEIASFSGPRAEVARIESAPADPLQRESARILTLLGMIHQRAGRYDQAESDYRKVLEVHRQWNEPQGVIAALYNLGQNAYLKGDFPASVCYYEEALGLIREIGYHEQELACLNNLAGAQVELGKFSHAESALRDVIRRAPAGWSMLPETYRWLALSYLGQRRYDEALSAGIKSLHLANQEPVSAQVGQAWRTLGRVAACFRGPVMIDNEPCTAHGCYAASLQVFVEMGSAGEQARTARQWAAYELEHGDYREGVRLWEEARELFARLGMPGEVERMDRMAAERVEK